MKRHGIIVWHKDSHDASGKWALRIKMPGPFFIGIRLIHLPKFKLGEG